MSTLFHLISPTLWLECEVFILELALYKMVWTSSQEVKVGAVAALVVMSQEYRSASSIGILEYFHSHELVLCLLYSVDLCGNVLEIHNEL